MEIGQILELLLTAGGISGIIALIITVSIAWRYGKHGDKEVPPTLSQALATILGFYFGSGVSSVVGQ